MDTINLSSSSTSSIAAAQPSAPPVNASGTANKANGSNVEPTYYPRNYDDISQVSDILVSLLLPELIEDILEEAEYWVRETSERNTQLAVREVSAGIVYVATGPIGAASGWGEHTQEVRDERSKGKEVAVPTMGGRQRRGPVKKIVFTLRSHDQVCFANYVNASHHLLHGHILHILVM